jgi:hypothetical protein
VITITVGTNCFIVTDRDGYGLALYIGGGSRTQVGKLPDTHKIEDGEELIVVAYDSKYEGRYGAQVFKYDLASKTLIVTEDENAGELEFNIIPGGS